MEDHCKRCKLAIIFVFSSNTNALPTIIIKISMFARLTGAGQLTTPWHDHFRTTPTTRPSGLPHPATRSSLLDTGAWTPVTARSHRYIHQWRCALRRPFPANPLSQAIPPTWISMTPPGQCHRRPMSHVYSINTVNQLTGLFPHGYPVKKSDGLNNPNLHDPHCLTVPLILHCTVAGFLYVCHVLQC